MTHISKCQFLPFAALILAVAVSSCSSADKKEAPSATVHNVFVTRPASQGPARTKDYAAVVQETRSIEAGFKTGGQIAQTYAKEGDYVRQGQLLARLDAADYDLAVRQLKVQYDQMANELKRKEKLHAAHNLSDNEFENAKSALAELGVRLDMNRNKLAYTNLYAPASGYVVKRSHEVGETVNAGTTVYELMDDSALEVIVDIPVSDFVSRENFESFTGRTSNAAGSAQMPLSMLSLTPKADNNQLYQLRLTVPSAQRKQITSGMNLTVTIRQKEGSDEHSQYTLPSRAIFSNDKGDASYVWVINPADSTISRRQVTTAQATPDAADRVTVTSGLDGRETVVRAGVRVLHQGEKVNILSQESQTNPGNLL